MCLAIPAKIIKIDKGMGLIDMEGTQREVSLLLQEGLFVQSGPHGRLREPP